MSWAELEMACKGYEVRYARSNYLQRYIASILLNVNRRKGAALVRPEDIMALYTDSKRKSKLMSKEEFEALKEERERIVWQNKN